MNLGAEHLQTPLSTPPVPGSQRGVQAVAVLVETCATISFILKRQGQSGATVLGSVNKTILNKLLGSQLKVECGNRQSALAISYKRRYEMSQTDPTI